MTDTEKLESLRQSVLRVMLSFEIKLTAVLDADRYVLPYENAQLLHELGVELERE